MRSVFQERGDGKLGPSFTMGCAGSLTIGDKPSVRKLIFPTMASDRLRLRIERLLDEAEDAITRYDWDVVRQVAQAVLAFEPENTEHLPSLANKHQDLMGKIVAGIRAVLTTPDVPRYVREIPNMAFELANELEIVLKTRVFPGSCHIGNLIGISTDQKTKDEED